MPERRRAAVERGEVGVAPARIPDYLALVGDSADGYPGIRGIGPVTASSLIQRHGPIMMAQACRPSPGP